MLNKMLSVILFHMLIYISYVKVFQCPVYRGGFAELSLGLEDYFFEYFGSIV